MMISENFGLIVKSGYQHSSINLQKNDKTSFRGGNSDPFNYKMVYWSYVSTITTGKK
ncbi:hypothetical protein Hanom_Chr01g00065301 [Helianthus anomalus]